MKIYQDFLKLCLEMYFHLFYGSQCTFQYYTAYVFSGDSSTITGPRTQGKCLYLLHLIIIYTFKCTQFVNAVNTLDNL